MHLERWIIYQKERFPLLKNGLLISVFSSSGVIYSALLTQEKPQFLSIIIAFVTTFCFFLLMRIADEFKDYEDDLKYRPYRPVPQGLVTLKELGYLGFFCLIIQLGATLFLAPSLTLLLLGIWLYFGLMCREFFNKTWLKQHPLIYLSSHIVIVPLINLYGTACDWWVNDRVFSSNLIWFLVASLGGGLLIEIGRKIRSPDQEELGVETYTFLWGKTIAILVWLGCLILTIIPALIASFLIGFNQTFIILSLGLLLIASWSSYQFWQQPTPETAKPIEAVSALAVLITYLSLGILPYFIQSLL
jgi:4-hydroxybenzoate polyprenyltransferase